MILTTDYLNEYSGVPLSEEFRKIVADNEPIDIMDFLDLDFSDCTCNGYCDISRVVSFLDNPEFAKKFIEKSNIELSSEVFYSINVINSKNVIYSTNVADCTKVNRSKDIMGSDDIYGCDGVTNSSRIKDSVNVFSSSDITRSSSVTGSRYIENSNNVFNSYCCNACNNIEECILCYHCSNLKNAILCDFMSGANEGEEYWICNRKVSKEEFEKNKNIFYNLVKLRKRIEFHSGRVCKEVFLEAGGDIKDINEITNPNNHRLHLLRLCLIMKSKFLQFLIKI